MNFAFCILIDFLFFKRIEEIMPLNTEKKIFDLNWGKHDSMFYFAA